MPRELVWIDQSRFHGWSCSNVTGFNLGHNLVASGWKPPLLVEGGQARATAVKRLSGALPILL